LLPKRADPVFGALIGTLILVAFLAPPLLILALIVWLVVRAERKSSQRAKPEADREFSARFHELENSIADANNVDARAKKRKRKRAHSANV
jgi:hypothetical protein